jgi:multiple sugar transport system permease protein
MTTKKKRSIVSDKLTFQGKYLPIMIKRKGLRILATVIRYTMLICLGFIIMTPIYMTLKEAIIAHSALGQKNTVWIPAETTMQSFSMAWLILKYDKAVAYSILNTALIALLQTACACTAAYSFSRLKFRGSNLLFGLVIFTIIVPPQSIMLAQYTSFRTFDIFGIIEAITGSPLNMIGSTYALYILVVTGMGVKGGLYIYIMRQSFRQLPISIEEAAYVDGAGFLRTFLKIVIPGVSASLTTVGVLSFVWNYADVYYMSLLNPTDLHLPLKMVRIQLNMEWAIMNIEKLIPQQYTVLRESPLVQKAVASACAFLVILPLLAMYIFVQKRFVQGVERSGLGGD